MSDATSPTSGPERRRARRHVLTEQASSLGAVMDLSRVGARVAGTGRPPLRIGETVTLNLEAADGQLRLPARVMWIRKPRFRQWEMGLEFVDIDLRKQVLIERLAVLGRLVPSEDAEDVGEAVAAECAAARRRGVRPASPASTAHPGAAAAAGAVHASFEEQDHYRVLQVQPDADAETIRLAFRMLAKRLHPDRNPSPDAQRRFESLKQAYDVLRDAERRARFDRVRAESSSRAA